MLGGLLCLLIISFGASPSSAGSGQGELSDADQQAFLAGSAALKKGDYAAAVRAFQQVIRSNNAFAPAYLNLGLAYHSQKDYQHAIQSFSRALELDGELASAALFLGIDYCIVNSPDKAVKQLQKALKLPSTNPQEVYPWLGKAYLGAGQYREAISYLEKALDASPDDPTVAYSLSRAHMLRYQQVLEDLYKKAPHSYMVHFLLGQSYQVQEKYDLAIASYRTALSLNHDLVGAHEALGDIALKLRKPEEAEAEFRKELALDPYNAKVKYKLGKVLDQSGAEEAAREQFEQAVKLQPTLVPARYELAKTQLRSGQAEEAIKNLQAATASDPDYAPAFILLGQAWARVGQQDKAQEAIQRGRALQAKKVQQIQENLGLAHPGGEQPEP